MCRLDEQRQSIPPSKEPNGITGLAIILGAGAVLAGLIALAMTLVADPREGPRTETYSTNRGAETSISSPRREGREPNMRAETKQPVRERVTVENPPQGNVAPARRATTNSPPVPAQSKYAVAAAQRRVDITMYSTSWCGVCTRARNYLDREGISYTEVDVEKNPRARARHRQLNPRGTVPTFDIDGNPMVGFSPGGFERALRNATQRHL